MTEEEAKKKAEYLIEKGYVVDKDIDTLVKEILKNINKNEFAGRPSPTL
jgi:hypothetical protein